MPELAAEVKQNIINNIEHIVEDPSSPAYKNLIDHIYHERIKISEFENNDGVQNKLNRIRRDVEGVREANKEAREMELREEEDWNSALESNTIGGYEIYLSNYPEGNYVQDARNKIDGLKETFRATKEAERNTILDTLKRNPLEYSPYQLERKINEGYITRADIVNHLGIKEGQLGLFLDQNHKDYFSDPLQWKDLPELPDDATDVYFFGIPASGKSCILSAFFYQAELERKIHVSTHNDLGYRYYSELTQAARIGLTPLSTPTETVNYMHCVLKNHRNNRVKSRHPLNILEMSGEYFNRTFEGTVDGGIGAQGYLSNENRKVLFLVFDYFEDNRTSGEYGPSQSQKARMENVLDKLSRCGVLDQTDLIYIILSKADMMDCPIEERESVGRNFMEEKYGNFMDNLEGLLRKYNINTVYDNDVLLQPFSLGKFHFKRVYDFNGSDASKLIQILIEQTRPTPRGCIWDSLLD